MAPIRAEEAAFGLPGGERCSPALRRPVDLVHLAHQTLGDRQLEQDILEMFVHQIVEITGKISACNEAERKRLAHQIKGSARGIGAFRLAECAKSIEDSPREAKLVAKLVAEIEQVREFIASISR